LRPVIPIELLLNTEMPGASRHDRIDIRLLRANERRQQRQPLPRVLLRALHGRALAGTILIRRDLAPRSKTHETATCKRNATAGQKYDLFARALTPPLGCSI
jgi:hypothetical protein